MSEIKNAEIVETEIIDAEIIMSESDARELTRTIQSTASALYILLKTAHDEKAYIALGYKDWSSYIDKEFDFSRVRSYQLINQANIIEQINESSGVELFITEREARAITKKLPEITEKLKEIKDKDLPPAQAEAQAKKVLDRAKDESKDIDMAKSYNANKDDSEKEVSEDTSPANGKEWTPAPIERILKDDDLFYYNNLMTTLKVFDSMPDASELGQTLNYCTKDTKELMKNAENAFAWLTRLMDELE